MEKPRSNGKAELRPLSKQEMLNVSGGSVVSFLVKFAQWGATYFFNMGVREGKKMRAQL